MRAPPAAWIFPTVLADEERNGRCKGEIELFVLEERDREGMNALLDPVLPQRDVREEGAAQNFTGFTFAWH